MINVLLWDFNYLRHDIGRWLSLNLFASLLMNSYGLVRKPCVNPNLVPNLFLTILFETAENDANDERGHDLCSWCGASDLEAMAAAVPGALNYPAQNRTMLQCRLSYWSTLRDCSLQNHLLTILLFQTHLVFSLLLCFHCEQFGHFPVIPSGWTIPLKGYQI